MTSLSSSTNLGKSLSRVPSFEELPNVDFPPTPTQAEVELAHISVEQHAHDLTRENTEIQLAYEEQRQTFEAEHVHDHQPAGEDHLVTVAELSARYEVNVNLSDPAASVGLSEEEAEKRLKEHGPNAITPAATIPEWKKFVKEFTGVFSIMLELAGLGCFANYGLQGAPENLFLGVALWLVVIISGSMNYHQTRKSSRVMSGFGQLVPQRTVVIRAGQLQSIAAENLVPGDILRVKGGDKIPADMRIIHCSGMKLPTSFLSELHLTITTNLLHLS